MSTSPYPTPESYSKKFPALNWYNSGMVDRITCHDESYSPNMYYDRMVLIRGDGKVLNGRGNSGIPVHIEKNGNYIDSNGYFHGTTYFGYKYP